MGALWELAQEYRQNQLSVDQRLEELRAELSQTRSRERARKLRRRIALFEEISAHASQTIYTMEHYYDKD